MLASPTAILPAATLYDFSILIFSDVRQRAGIPGHDCAAHRWQRVRAPGGRHGGGEGQDGAFVGHCHRQLFAGQECQHKGQAKGDGVSVLADNSNMQTVYVSADCPGCPAHHCPCGLGDRPPDVAGPGPLHHDCAATEVRFAAVNGTDLRCWCRTLKARSGIQTDICGSSPCLQCYSCQPRDRGCHQSLAHGHLSVGSVLPNSCCILLPVNQ